MIENIKAFGKFLDQPRLISKLNKNIPVILTAAASAYLLKTGSDTFSKAKTEDEKAQAKKDVFKKAIVLYSAVASALMAPYIASKLTKRQTLPSLDKVKETNINLIDSFIKENAPEKETLNILEKAKERILSFKEVKKLNETLSTSETGKAFLEKFIPDPENIKAKDIFSEIGFLSIYGAIPVAGGILGGVASDVLTKEDYKKNLPDKVNEGLYQYLANIFMCNVGAGGALAILEKMNVTSKLPRAIGMTLGIILTGVLGGSKIANFISNKVISPLVFNDKKETERKPELLDLGLHTDDIATVSLLSGLKWIEPSLPVLYSVSGYKSGIGYRN